MFFAVAHGFVLALSLIIPLGVQNVFVFNQGATQTKFFKAIPVIVTASICDTILITLAVQGVSLIVLGNNLLRSGLIIFGVIFLLYMGWITWTSKISKLSGQNTESLSTAKQIIFAISVSLFNPHAIMDTIGVIGTSALTYDGTEKLVFGVSAIVVSWIWFFLIATLGKTIGKLDNTGNLMTLINKISAVIMWGVAFFMLYQNTL